MFYAFCHNWSIVLCETKSKLFPARIPNYQAVFRKVWILYKFGFLNKSKLLDLFRRTRATGMYRDGVPLEMISVILGHASSETTKIYAIPSVEQMREALKKGQPENDAAEKLWVGREDELRKMFGLD